jgi:hypothetical protein
MRQAKLLEIVHALGAAGGLAGRLHGRQQQSNQDADNCNDHEKLDERKAGIPSAS